MAYTYDNLRLEKGMYGEAGKSFTQVLEAADPSENYRGTPLEGLDAFQRQLKRFDIHVKGSRSDVDTSGICVPSGAAGYGGGQCAAFHHRYHHAV